MKAANVFNSIISFVSFGLCFNFNFLSAQMEITCHVELDVAPACQNLSKLIEITNRLTLLQSLRVTLPQKKLKNIYIGTRWALLKGRGS